MPFMNLGHVSLRDAVEEPILPRGRGHCMQEQDVRFVIPSQPTYNPSVASLT